MAEFSALYIWTGPTSVSSGELADVTQLVLSGEEPRAYQRKI